MDDLISRQAAIDGMRKLQRWNVVRGYNKNEGFLYDDVMYLLGKLPPAQPERRKAKWIDGHCSNCGCDIPAYIIDWKWQKDMDAKFCPNCGADMRGERNEID